MRPRHAAVASYVLMVLLCPAGAAAEEPPKAPLDSRDLIEILRHAPPAPNPPPARSFTSAESAAPEQRLTMEFDPDSGTLRVVPASSGEVSLSEGRHGTLDRDPDYRTGEAVDGVRQPSDTIFPLPDATNFPYNTVVKLIQRYNVAGVDHWWSCSGALVHDFHVITAGHCVYSWDPNDDGAEDDRNWADEIWVFPAQGDAVEPFDVPDWPYGGARAELYRSYSGWTDDHNFDHDWAVLTLNRRDGDHTGWMGKESGLEAAILNASGYPVEAAYGFEGNLLQYHTQPIVVGYSPHRIYVAALLYGGQSGGPAWRYHDGLRSIQGVLSTSSRTGSAKFTRMTSGKHADLNAYIAEDQALLPPIPRPDLQECFFYGWGCDKGLFSASIGQGGVLYLGYNALNSGFANSGDLRIDYYLSVDDTIDAGDILLHTAWANGLEPLTAYSPLVSLPVPLTVPPGPYYVGWILTGTDPEYTLGPHGGTAWPDGNNTVVIANDTVTVIEIHDLTVTSPAGGETWYAGSTASVDWTSRNAGARVRIELSRDGGASWETLATQTSNDGSFSWVVGGNASDFCRIRVTSLEYPGATDTSPADFRIVPGQGALRLTAPNGGEDWIVGRDHDISWTSLLAGPRVKIELSRNAGVSWLTLAPDTPNDGLFTWTVTSPASNLCRIRVSSLSAPTLTDTSDGGFSILQLLSTIHLLSPNGGETVWVGHPFDITWSSSFLTGNVKIELTRNSGLTWDTVTAATPNDGHFGWVATTPTSGACRVRVSSAEDSRVGDTSDASFSVLLLMSSINLIAPDGGETWYTGYPHNITWSSSFLSGDVRLELTRNAGLTWGTIVSSTPNDGLFVWSPTSPLSPDCAIRVSSVASPGISDQSDQAFTIGLLISSLNLLSPNGGEDWYVGGTYDVAWNSSFVTSDIRVEVTRDDGASWELLAANTPNDGHFDWVADAPASGACRIRITSVDVSALATVSAGSFRVLPLADVSLESIRVTEDDGIQLSWSDTAGAEQYEVYRGELMGPFSYVHDEALICDLLPGTTDWIADGQAGPGWPSYYYLVAPRIGDVRSYGRDSDGAPRPPSASECP